MIFVTDETKYQELLKENHTPLKVVFANERFVEAWFSERNEPQNHVKSGKIELKHTFNGLFGTLSLDVNSSDKTLQQLTTEAYLQIFQALEAYPDLTVIRYWNYVPEITAMLADGSTHYHSFNAGRYTAFKTYYGDKIEQLSIPAASAVGSKDKILKIQFFAVSRPIKTIENKGQIPAYHYSKTYGKIPPFFSRGVIFDNHGQRLLLSSGTASVVGENSMHSHDIYEQLVQTFHNLRVLGSQFNLKMYEIHFGFALEDIVLLTVYYKQEQDRPFLERFIPKFLAPSCQIAFQHADICREELSVELEAIFVKKGESEQGNRPKYVLDEEQRIRTESFEIHVTEHCNLKCRDCCNLSPYNPKKFMSLDEVQEICNFVKLHFKPDVFKILGGEPTLHPQLDELLKLVKQSGVSKTVRVVTNGLLLHRMSDEFWQLIDQLTISNYVSAPIRPKILDEIKAKAKHYEVVLNIKHVEQFNEIHVDEAITDKARVQHVYDDCWMRHRCLLVRNGRFYKCTVASYMNSYLTLKGKSINAGESTYSEEDGILLQDPKFKEKALHYLNCTIPLSSCEYCLGVSGNLRENIQMKNSDFRLKVIE